MDISASSICRFLQSFVSCDMAVCVFNERVNDLCRFYVSGIVYVVLSWKELWFLEFTYTCETHTDVDHYERSRYLCNIIVPQQDV